MIGKFTTLEDRREERVRKKFQFYAVILLVVDGYSFYLVKCILVNLKFVVALIKISLLPTVSIGQYDIEVDPVASFHVFFLADEVLSSPSLNILFMEA